MLVDTTVFEFDGGVRLSSVDSALVVPGAVAVVITALVDVAPALLERGLTGTKIGVVVCVVVPGFVVELVTVENCVEVDVTVCVERVIAVPGRIVVVLATPWLANGVTYACIVVLPVPQKYCEYGTYTVVVEGAEMTSAEVR